MFGGRLTPQMRCSSCWTSRIGTGRKRSWPCRSRRQLVSRLAYLTAKSVFSKSFRRSRSTRLHLGAPPRTGLVPRIGSRCEQVASFPSAVSLWRSCRWDAIDEIDHSPLDEALCTDIAASDRLRTVADRRRRKSLPRSCVVRAGASLTKLRSHLSSTGPVGFCRNVSDVSLSSNAGANQSGTVLSGGISWKLRRP